MWHQTSIMSVDLCYMTKVILETSIIALDTKLVAVFWPFSAWCPLKCHTYLNKPAAESPFFPFFISLKSFQFMLGLLIDTWTCTAKSKPVKPSLILLNKSIQVECLRNEVSQYLTWTLFKLLSWTLITKSISDSCLTLLNPLIASVALI